MATAIIDRSALRHNLQQVRHQALQSHLIAIIKANAYGHCMLEIAYALKDADYFGVSRISEALDLRLGGIVKPILLLEGFLSAEDLPLLVENKIETVIHSVEQLEELEQATLAYPLPVWMKLDTGMHRLGVQLEQSETFYQRLCACRNVVQPVNIISHFSCADRPESDITRKQIACFERFPVINQVNARSLLRAEFCSFLTHIISGFGQELFYTAYPRYITPMVASTCYSLQ